MSQVHTASLGFLDNIGCLIIIFGITGESVADWQLQEFKSNFKGKVCNVGLWRYSRHPNYFFDWLTWLGFTFFSLSYTYGYIGLISPLFCMLFLQK